MTCTTMRAEIKESDNGIYGIVIRREGGCERLYEAITKDLSSLERLARLINDGDVSETHIVEILEDIIG